jgi:endonuclease YncB( thermonuclease family)
MKKQFCLFVFLITLVKLATAQNNYCDDITRDTDAVTKTITWHTPELNINIKAIVTDTAQLWISFNIAHQSEFIAEEGGLFIRFDDGKSLKYFGQQVSRKYLSAREGYYYQTDMPIKPNELLWFKTKKITKYQIAGIDVPVTADLATEIQAYLICITGNFDKKAN